MVNPEVKEGATVDAGTVKQFKSVPDAVSFILSVVTEDGKRHSLCRGGFLQHEITHYDFDSRSKVSDEYVYEAFTTINIRNHLEHANIDAVKDTWKGELANMKIKEISAGASNTMNLQNYNSAQIRAGVVAEVEEGDNVDECLDTCFEKVTEVVHTRREKILARIYGD